MKSKTQRVTLQKVGDKNFQFSIDREHEESAAAFDLRLKIVIKGLPGQVIDKGPGRKTNEEIWYYVDLPDNDAGGEGFSRTRHRLDRYASPLSQLSRFAPEGDISKDKVAVIMLNLDEGGSERLPSLLWNNQHEPESSFSLRAEVALNRSGWEVVSRGFSSTKRQVHWTLSRMQDGFCS